MKGFLAYLTLKLISKKPMSGEDIREEIEKRRGTRPSPGTIYPCLKHLVDTGLIVEETRNKMQEARGKEKKYVLTQQGKKALENATRQFIRIFGDLI